MEIKKFDGHGRKIMVQFSCHRCNTAALRPLIDCMPADKIVRDLHDLVPPAAWRDGGFYYPTLCPECAEKYDKFMRGEDNA